MIPTLDELANILLASGKVGRSKPRTYADLDDDWKVQVIAEVRAVRDAVLEGVAESSTGYHVLYVNPETGLSFPGSESYPLADYIRSLKGSPE